MVTNEKFGYTNWNSGEPNNYGGNENIGVMYKNGTWNDTRELELGNGFICEYEPLSYSINYKLNGGKNNNANPT